MADISVTRDTALVFIRENKTFADATSDRALIFTRSFAQHEVIDVYP